MNYIYTNKNKSFLKSFLNDNGIYVVGYLPVYDFRGNIVKYIPIYNK